MSSQRTRALSAIDRIPEPWRVAASGYVSLLEAENADLNHERDTDCNAIWAVLRQIRCAYYADPKAADGACPDGDIPEMLATVRDWMAEVVADRDRLRESLREYMDAMKLYEADADSDQPYEHRAMRERATAALTPPHRAPRRDGRGERR